jgi:hypothetical protein
MPRKPIIMLFVFLLAIAATAVTAQAETLAWNAVTTYTDGSPIGGATVTYTAYWSTSSNLTNLQTLGSGTATSRTFNVDTAGMQRNSTVYFTVKSTVGGVDSALATAMSWNVPAGTPPVPSAPSNLRMN